MIVKDILDEDFVNYKKPSMMIAFPYCSFKCDKECGRAVCQNSPLANEPNIEISCESIIERYLDNSITEAIVFQGLEPFDSLKDVFDFVVTLRGRYGCSDDVVIYTGYTKEEVDKFTLSTMYPFMDGTCTGNIKITKMLKSTGNIIIKYGRYIPDQKPHYDKVLGVNLASDNQYAERL